MGNNKPRKPRIELLIKLALAVGGKWKRVDTQPLRYGLELQGQWIVFKGIYSTTAIHDLTKSHDLLMKFVYPKLFEDERVWSRFSRKVTDHWPGGPDESMVQYMYLMVDPHDLACWALEAIKEE